MNERGSLSFILTLSKKLWILTANAYFDSRIPGARENGRGPGVGGRLDKKKMTIVLT